MDNTIKLETTSILHVPINNYDENFTFVINDEEFQTSRLQADLISPKISSYHLIDPTISRYDINTSSSGSFKKILNLISFEQINISNDEIPFINEIFEKLEITNKFITINIENEDNNETTNDNESNNFKNILNRLEKHHQFSFFYQSQIKNDIDELSKQFYNIEDEDKENILKLGYNIIESIISNSNLKLEDEDDIIDFINFLYSKDSKYCNLYPFVYFNNVTGAKMTEFINIVDFHDISKEIWKSLCERLSQNIVNQNIENNDIGKIRYTGKAVCNILYNNQNLDGIIQWLQNKFNIKDEIDLTSSNNASSIWNIISYKEEKAQVNSGDEKNSWFCIEFKNHEIMPTNYTIKSGTDSDNLKSFVLEGSQDKNEWTILDEENDISYLKESKSVHTFPIKNKKFQTFKYLRVRITGENWNNKNYLQFCCIEFYGKLYKNKQ